MSTNVFLSYSSADYSVAQEVQRTLESSGLTVFDVQNLSAGSVWVSEVDGALKSVDIVVAIISNSYSASAYTTSEWTVALAGRKRVVPVVVEPGARVPALLAPYIGIDISDPSTRAAKLEMLARQIKTPGASDSPADEIGSMKKRLTESRSQWATATAILELGVNERAARFRMLAISLAGTFLVVTTVVVIVLTVNDSFNTILNVLAPALTGVIGTLLGWSFGTDTRYSPKLNRALRNPVADPDSQATNEDGVRS